MDSDMFSVFDEEAPSETIKKRKSTSEPDTNNNLLNDLQLKKPRKVLEKPVSQVPQTSVEDITTPMDATEKSKTRIPESQDTISCLHEICFPPSAEENTMDIVFPSDPVRTWKFSLDPFQRTAVSCIHQGQSVLVSAHTSAGKTVVAEYAIALALKLKQRVIYTSPIKALSNQKYRELYEEFQDVGLMTGDITINPTANCLVMTTEILRSMLYRGSEVMREVAWVIFDEIHYMRDKERGVVWEETIIMLPQKVRFVFLSATIPNAKEFASWIAKIHNQPCHVVYTDVRPIPLQHYIFPAGGEGLHLVVDEKGVFREDNFQKALAAMGSADVKRSQSKGTKGPSDVYKIVKMIQERNYQPVIVFAFSKKECEALALQMAKLDLTTAAEKQSTERIFNNAIDSLNEDDKKLPQVIHILPLLKRGIGIHHSGLLPILKEVIEILFQEQLIKALFATETFSMGLNMPAKTVVFTSVRKFDGANFRWVSSGEYIQMSGRAGRRGKDDRGIVILMVDEKMEPAVAKNMVKGSADPLNSSFYIGYNMLLNLLRSEEFDPEYMLKKSFHQFQADRNLPDLEHKLQAVEREKQNLVIPSEETVAEYYHLQSQLKTIHESIRETVNHPIHSLPYLQPGRLVRVKDGEIDWGWGVVVNFQKKQEKLLSYIRIEIIPISESETTGEINCIWKIINSHLHEINPIGKEKDSLNSENSPNKFIVDVLLNSVTENNKSRPPRANETGAMTVIPVSLALLDGMSSIRVYIPKEVKSNESRQIVSKSLREVQKRFVDGIPLLDPIEDMKIEDASFKKLIRKLETVEDKLQSNPNFKTVVTDGLYEQYCRKMTLEAQIKELKKQVKLGQTVILKHELKCMKRVLRRLGYTTAEDIVETKGRVACEINAADELVITELIFGGVFNELSIEQGVAMLSCFVFQEKVDANMKLKEELAGPFRQLQETARRIAQVSQECKISINVDEYVQKFSPHMMDVVYSWCKGAKFSEICHLTDIFEGSIIRCMRRLEELLRQLCAAAKSIGNSELENKFAEGINKIKRDIVFAASLYL